MRLGLGYRNKIRYKLFAVFIVVAFAPLAICSYYVVELSARDARSSASFAAGQLAVQAAQFIEAKADLVTRAVNTIDIDGEVRELAMRDPEAYARGLTEWNIDSLRLRSILLAAQMTDPELREMRIYMERGLASAYEDSQLRRLGPERSSAWVREASERGPLVHWFRASYFPGEKASGLVFAVGRIPDNMNLQAIAGFVRAGFPAGTLENILAKARFSALSTALILDAEGAIVASSGPEADVGRRRAPSIAPESGTEAGVPAPQSLRDESLQSFSLRIRDADWRLALLVPAAEIDAFGQKARSRLSLIILIIAPLMFPLAFWSASKSTERLGRLARGVREFDEGNLALALPMEGDDEISELAAELNRMASRIASLVDEKYRLGLEARSLELKALQAQINPHFLYNSLDLINCLALRGGEGRISEAAASLSQFYRLALSAGAETVTVAQEIEHVATYVRIQNMRFESAIELVVDLSREFMATPMLKIALQPLAENAVLHGILEKPEGRGRIAIGGRLESGGSVLTLEIEDDGVGMTADIMDRLFEERQDEKGYCVRNIDRRLRLKYGESFGLSYRSEPGRGTTATVRIPSASAQDLARSPERET